jgi:hypothetical protein
MQTWEDAVQYEKKDWKWLLDEFLQRSAIARGKQAALNKTAENTDLGSEDSGDNNNEQDVSSDADGDQTPMVWKELKQFSELVQKQIHIKLSCEDREHILQKKALYSDTVDYAMAILAKQTKKFHYLSSIFPMEGYPSAIDDEDASKGHVSIHHCGDQHKHWITSFLERPSSTSPKNIVWMTLEFKNHKRMSAKVLTELTDLYFVKCPKKSMERNIRLIPMASQQQTSSCGYLAIAAAAEIALGNTSLKQLYRTQFDESQIHTWLVGCIENGTFTSCPSSKEPVNAKADRTGGKGYWEWEIKEDFIQYLIPSKQRKRLKPRQGWGDDSAKWLHEVKHLSTSTAPSQHAQPKLISGCVIQLLYTSSINRSVEKKWAGDWKITDINADNKEVMVTNANDAMKKYSLPADLLFRITSPPCLVVEIFRTLSAYQLIADKIALTLVYPVVDCRLSDVAFASEVITKSVILEIVRCNSEGDIESMLTVMSNRKVWMYVKIQDFISYRKLTRYLEMLHCEKPTQQENVIHTYQKNLDVALSLKKVNLHRPGNADGCDMYDVLRNMDVLIDSVWNLPIALPYKSSVEMPMADDILVSTTFPIPDDVLVSTPVSSREKRFPRGTEMSKINDWGIQKYGSQESNKNVSGQVLFLRPCVSQADVLRTTVFNGKVIRQEMGLGLSEDTIPILKKAALNVIQRVRTITMPVAAQWESYRFDVYLNIEKQGVVNHVSTWESPALLNDFSETLHVKGLIAVGGNKVVLLAYTRNDTNLKVGNQPVILYKLRDPSSQSQANIFRNDISMLIYVRENTRHNPLPCVLKMYRNWTINNQHYATVEKMDMSVRAGLKQWEMTFGMKRNRQTTDLNRRYRERERERERER